jgi:site-specific recombinase XerC
MTELRFPEGSRFASSFPSRIQLRTVDTSTPACLATSWAVIAQQPVDMDNFRNRVYWIACDKAKIRRRRFHDTRHTFASILLMNGESPAYVKEQLGHSSIKITVDVYGHFIPGANRQAVNKLPSLDKTQALIAGRSI